MTAVLDFAVSDAPEVQAQLDRLDTLSVPTGRLGLDIIRELLERLGNPQDALPPVFHVAGTNGKGSTCAYLRAALEAAGKTVHVFTSPHLVRFNERIRVSGKLITDEMLAERLREVLDVAEAHGIATSFFEAATAAAFLAFSRNPADACVIEVGLGGRLDATNILAKPVACGIAALGIDHEQFLLSPCEGAPADPFARIAFEKAGIAKTGSPLITLDYAEAMNAAVDAQADRAGAHVLRQGRDWSIALTDTGFTFRDAKGSLNLPRPRLPGDHQVQNAGLAIAMLRSQSALDVDEDALRRAMETANWPARLQRLSSGPLTALLPEGTPCWLDGGHNVDAGNALDAHFRGCGRTIHLVIGMLANKNPAALVAPLADCLASVTVVPVPTHAYHDPEAFALAGVPSPVAAQTVAEALSGLKVEAEEIVLIAGSLYLAGGVLRANEEVPD